MKPEYTEIPPELLGKPDPDQQWIEAQLDRIAPHRHEQGAVAATDRALRQLVLELRHSLRDNFAAKAMAGMLAGTLTPDSIWSQDEVAETAYQMADAMLKARAA